MEEQNKVSIWIGSYDSNIGFKDLIKERFCEEGDLFSNFMNEFKIEFIDNQFQEVLFSEEIESSEQLFMDFSYSSKFIDKLPEKEWSNYNCVICLYNFAYSGSEVSSENMEFLGIYDC